VQPVAFKATEEKKEEPIPTNRLPIDASKIDNKEMTLIIKNFRQILKQRKGKDYKNPAPRGFASGMVSPVTILLNVHIQVIVTGTTTRKGRTKWRRRSTTTRRKAARYTWEGSGTPTRAPSTPPPTRTLPTSSSTYMKDLSFGCVVILPILSALKKMSQASSASQSTH
jgi:hypothetical protein